MKKILLLLIINLFFNSCSATIEQEKYNFDNFKETPLWELAKAVRKDDAKEVKRVLKSKNLYIDFKNPKYQQTLLALSIQNKRPIAFIELLKSGTETNILLGNLKDETTLK